MILIKTTFLKLSDSQYKEDDAVVQLGPVLQTSESKVQVKVRIFKAFQVICQIDTCIC